MDGSLSRMRGKADFRLMRELLGLPQEWVAKRVGVDARTVRNWESPRYFYPPKREAWDLVEGLWRRADAKAAGLVEIASSGSESRRRIQSSPVSAGESSCSNRSGMVMGACLPSGRSSRVSWP